MATIQHSIEINVPVQTLYNQLTQFEAYPAFWENIESVAQIDDTHLHWSSKEGKSLKQWDTLIIEQKADQLIELRNSNDNNSASDTFRIEVQSLSPYSSKAVVTVEIESGKPAGLITGEDPDAMTYGLKQNLENLKIFMETLESETGAWRGEIEGGDVTVRGREARDQVRQTAGRRSPASDSGSPTEVLDDEPDEAGFGTTFSKNTDEEGQSSGKTQRGVVR